MNTSFMIANEDVPVGSHVTGFCGELSRSFREVKLAGFESIELMICDPSRVRVEKIRTLMDEHKLSISLICSGEMGGTMGFSLNDIDDHNRRASIVAFKKAINIARELNTNINIGRLRGKIWNGDEKASLKRLAESLNEIDIYISEEAPDVSVLIEPLRPDICDILNNCEDTRKFIQKNHLENIYLMLDSDHIDWNIDIDFIKNNVSWIRHIHLADTLHKPLGMGNIDFDYFFELIKSSGYTGYFSVEVFCETDQQMTLRESKTFLDKFIY